ncbi:2-amino-4-hydroxy-6-hydroxymethyldihydropteridine diphosphokinase [Rhodomicrobium vannielii]|uniref:2-amino-4-hydroxy-6- hydroxymethyldihydropteridine diphosphokinase n=1 Tax=Rhodomicrobium vannielii TaxID=1069 RepID=UPI003D7C357A
MPQADPIFQQLPRTPGVHSRCENLHASTKFKMIIIGMGSNVTSRWGDSYRTIAEGLNQLEGAGIPILRHSRFYRTSPLGPADQPDYFNAAAIIGTSLPAIALLSLLKKIETAAGRRSSVRWGPRALDIDILDYNRQILNWQNRRCQRFKCNEFRLILPHPGIESRPFVLQPLQDIAPYWHHPVYGLNPAQFLARLRGVKMGRIIDTVSDTYPLIQNLQSLHEPEKIAT